LEAEPYRFGFMSVLRKLEAISDDKPRLGESVRSADDPVRLGHSPSLAFAPGSLFRFTTGDAATPDRLESFFLGLFGANGAMPIHISEYIYGREINHGDKTLRCFADIFHHRILSLFYRVCASVEPTFNMDRPDENRFDLFIGALAGIGPDAFRDRDALPDATKLFNVAGLALQTRPAEGLRTLLEDYFELDFSIDEMVGEWLPLAADDRLYVGRAGSACTLGVTTILGSHIWSCQHKFRIACGPLSLVDFKRLLPGEESVNALIAAVRNYVGDEFAWDLQLILKEHETPSIRLGQSGFLGWTSWLGARADKAHPGVVVIDPQRSTTSGFVTH
jgi:type VI secretion system protein ImpH